MNPDAFTRPFQLTKSMQRDLYPAVDPKNPELKATGKTVLVTGAGGGLGGEIARAWAQAGAKGIILVGRTPSLLEEPTEAIKSLNSATKVLVTPGDIVSESDVKGIFDKAVAEFGKVDVVVHAAATSTKGMIGDLEPSEWFKDYDINVKGTYNLVYYFLKQGGGEGGTFINLVSLGASFVSPGISSYSGSKLAVIKLGEYLAAEKPNLRTFHIHPGIVGVTETGRGAVVDAFTPFAKDKGILTGGVSLYLATPKADYLNGGYLSVNWDLDEMEAHKKEIVDSKLLKLGFINAKVGPEGHPWAS